MTPKIFLDGKVELYAGDCLEVLAGLPENSVDSICCDPPYHLQSIQKRFAAKGRDEMSERYSAGPYGRHATGFMGKAWDGGDIAFRIELWELALRVLKPGGHLVAFSHVRTYHRMACAIEDAGFEIRDQIGWAYGSGFPKSHDVAKSIDKAARGVPHGGPDQTSPNHGRFKGGCSAENSKGQGFGAGPGQFMAEAGERADRELVAEAQPWIGFGTALKPAWEPICLARKPLQGTVAANVLAHGTGAINIDGCRVGDDVRVYQSSGAPGGNGQRLNGGDGRDAEAAAVYGAKSRERGEQVAMGRWPANIVHDGSEEVLAAFPDTGFSSGGGGLKISAGLPDTKAKGAFYEGNVGFMDSGSAARFFYTSKADAEDRLGSRHPTVKPLDLMQWLVRLVTPPCVTAWECINCSNEALSGMQEGIQAKSQDASFVLGSMPPSGRGAGAEVSNTAMSNVRCSDDVGAGVENVLLGQVRASGAEKALSAMPDVRNAVRSEVGAEVLLSSVRASLSGQEASAVPSMPEGICPRTPAPAVLQSEVRSSEPHTHASDDAVRLHNTLDARASDGTQIGILDGTSPSHGAASRSQSRAARSRPSRQRNQDRQSGGESSGDGGKATQSLAQGAAQAGRVPPLQADHSSRKCSACGGELKRVNRRGVVLDMFAGTGTTGEAAWREGMRAILIERESEYQGDIARRMELATNPTKRAAVAKSKNNLERPEDLPLFSRTTGD